MNLTEAVKSNPHKERQIEASKGSTKLAFFLTRTVVRAKHNMTDILKDWLNDLKLSEKVVNVEEVG